MSERLQEQLLGANVNLKKALMDTMDDPQGSERENEKEVCFNVSRSCHCGVSGVQFIVTAGYIVACGLERKDVCDERCTELC